MQKIEKKLNKIHSLLSTLCSMLSILLLTGCSQAIAPLVCDWPSIELPPDPPIAVVFLKDDAMPDEVIKAWVETAYAYRDWNKAVREQIQESI